MRTLFWFCGLGVAVVAGLIYLTASKEHHASQTLGGTTQMSEECLSARLHGHSCISAPTQTEANCPIGMPLQIIDVCQPAHNWSCAEDAARPELVPAAHDLAAIDDAEEIGMPQVVDEPDQPCVVLHGDVAEAEELPMPKCDEENSEPMPPACDEDSPFFKFWLGVFDKMDPADEAAPTEEEIPSPMEEAQEEPACEEDPHHPEHYPHCPYMGGRSCPSYYPTSVPKPQRCGDGEECEPCPHSEPDADSPPQPGVDTMEFRPTDAKDGEFEAKPM